MSWKYDILVILADSQGFPVDSDGYVDSSSPQEQDIT